MLRIVVPSEEERPIGALLAVLGAQGEQVSEVELATDARACGRASPSLRQRQWQRQWWRPAPKRRHGTAGNG